MTERLSAVFDTNVFVSALLSRNPTSPTQELLRRWLADEFTLLISQALLIELVEKLQARGVSQQQVHELLIAISRLAEWVEVPAEALLPVVVNDPDDDHVLACAVAGQADYLVTYDPHFDILRGSHRGVRITKALPFLWAIRGDSRPVDGDPTGRA
ncbi:MAG: putative toxin-antitoxin system toxin component, PIN family [Anaerolineae bacterium]|nr:putative toxin-antitoxin system toxin component, PIN family [Anaerolineae bacterium]